MFCSKFKKGLDQVSVCRTIDPLVMQLIADIYTIGNTSVYFNVCCITLAAYSDFNVILKQ